MVGGTLRVERGRVEGNSAEVVCDEAIAKRLGREAS